MEKESKEFFGTDLKHPLVLNCDDKRMDNAWKLIGNFEDGLTKMRVIAHQVSDVGALVRVDVQEKSTDKIISCTVNFLPTVKIHDLHDKNMNVDGFKLGNKSTMDMTKRAAL